MSIAMEGATKYAAADCSLWRFGPGPVRASTRPGSHALRNQSYGAAITWRHCTGNDRQLAPSCMRDHHNPTICDQRSRT
jgi:hypothetical protein